MTPIWSPEAINDLAALRAYSEQDDPAAAQRVALHIIRNIETLLPNNPEMGRPGRVPGKRELVIPKTPFIVPYRLVGNMVRFSASFTGLVDGPKDFKNTPVV
jgi:toxin ParE1/3/4